MEQEYIDISSSDGENESEPGHGSHPTFFNDGIDRTSHIAKNGHGSDDSREGRSNGREKLSTSYSSSSRQAQMQGHFDAGFENLLIYGNGRDEDNDIPSAWLKELEELDSISDSDLQDSEPRPTPVDNGKRTLPPSLMQNGFRNPPKPSALSPNVSASHSINGHDSSQRKLLTQNFLKEGPASFDTGNRLPLNQHINRRALPPSLLPTMSKTVNQASKKKSSDQLRDPVRGPNDNDIPTTSYKGYSMGDLESLDDDDLYIYETSGSHRKLPPWGSARNSNKFEIHANAMEAGTSTVGDPLLQDGRKASSHRFLPSSISGKTVLERHSTNFQMVDLSGGREYTVVGEQPHVQHDERLIFEVALQDLSQPKCEADLPDGLLSVPLLRHQKIALAWLDQKETSGLPCSGGILADDQGLGKTVSMIALVQKQRPLQAKFMSNKSDQITSETLNLDEDENTASKNGKEDCVKEDLKSEPSISTSRPSVKGRPAAGTLVVCPASVLRQWGCELEDKVASSAKLSVLIYHGGTRTKCPADLSKYDVVLTTYAIVTNEVPKKPLGGDDEGERRNSEEYALSSDFSAEKKRKATSSSKKKKKGKGILESDGGPLAGVRWFRVILDEAQIIKNHRTQVARACCGLRAKRRWCLSGTPMQNAIDDVYSYFRFLRYDPYATYSTFCSTIKAPILRNADTGYKKLQAVLKTVMLRRTKGTILDGKPILKLPPKSISLKKLSFSLEERSFYTGLEADFRERFKRYAVEGTVKQNYASILLMLLRLRQACDHPLLVKDYASESAGKTSVETAKKLPKLMLTSLLNQLEASLPICGLCNDPPEDAVITLCGHIFCYQCISENLAADENLCPASGCREILTDDSLFSKGTLKSCLPDGSEKAIMNYSGTTEESARWQSGFTSSKIAAALEILTSLRDSYNLYNSITNGSCLLDSEATLDACESLGLQPKLQSKAIVFSQWTSMLNFLEDSLNQSLIQYRRLDGSMSLALREQAVKDFTTDPEVTVMLMSLKAGNLGLNMIAACHVILLDLWWNPTSEDQAIDRAHRIGQTKAVMVYRLTIEDTVEERILRLQEKKREMVSSAFGEDPSGKGGSKLTVEDLRYLFQV